MMLSSAALASAIETSIGPDPPSPRVNDWEFASCLPFASHTAPGSLQARVGSTRASPRLLSPSSLISLVELAPATGRQRHQGQHRAAVGRAARARRGRTPAIVSKREFQRIAKTMQYRAPKKVNPPRRVSSPYLLSGLAKCETCGKAITAAEAKSGKYTYYISHSLLKRGKGTCKTPRLNA